jgi:hypothetical protein
MKSMFEYTLFMLTKEFLLQIVIIFPAVAFHYSVIFIIDSSDFTLFILYGIKL